MLKYGQVTRVILGEFDGSKKGDFSTRISRNLRYLLRIRADEGAPDGRTFKGAFYRMDNERLALQKPDILVRYAF